jgi:hypothetical protein
MAILSHITAENVMGDFNNRLTQFYKIESKYQ